MKAKPWLGISPQNRLSQLQPGKGCARGVGTPRSHPWEALLPGGLAQTQKPRVSKAMCFPSDRRTLATSLMSQMERAAQESPEPSGCLPVAPLQPKWKNIWPQCSTRLLRPRAPVGLPPGPADAETLMLAFWPNRFRKEAEATQTSLALQLCSSLIITSLLLIACAKTWALLQPLVDPSPARDERGSRRAGGAQISPSFAGATGLRPWQSPPLLHVQEGQAAPSTHGPTHWRKG